MHTGATWSCPEAPARWHGFVRPRQIRTGPWRRVDSLVDCRCFEPTLRCWTNAVEMDEDLKSQLSSRSQVLTCLKESHQNFLSLLKHFLAESQRFHTTTCFLPRAAQQQADRKNTFSSSSSVDTAAWKRGWLMAKGPNVARDHHLGFFKKKRRKS